MNNPHQYDDERHVTLDLIRFAQPYLAEVTAGGPWTEYDDDGDDHGPSGHDPKTRKRGWLELLEAVRVRTEAELSAPTPGPSVQVADLIHAARNLIGGSMLLTPYVKGIAEVLRDVVGGYEDEDAARTYWTEQIIASDDSPVVTAYNATRKVWVVSWQYGNSDKLYGVDTQDDDYAGNGGGGFNWYEQANRDEAVAMYSRECVAWVGSRCRVRLMLMDVPVGATGDAVTEYLMADSDNMEIHHPVVMLSDSYQQ